jgi:hypothetical protein
MNVGEYYDSAARRRSSLVTSTSHRPFYQSRDNRLRHVQLYFIPVEKDSLCPPYDSIPGVVPNPLSKFMHPLRFSTSNSSPLPLYRDGLSISSSPIYQGARGRCDAGVCWVLR